MIMRAWQRWLKDINPEERRARRRTLISGAESLEKRIVPAISGTSTSSTATAISLSLTNGEDVSIGFDGTRLTYDTGSGAVPFGGDLGALSSPRLTINCSNNLVNDILIDSSLNSSSGLTRITMNLNGGGDSADAAATDIPVSINGGSGNDNLIGGSGNDTIDGSSGKDEISGEDGDDTLRGSADDDVLTGGFGEDDLDGGAGADDLSGNEDDDYCLGGTGNDSIYGGDGNDVVNGQGDDDKVYGDAGNDYVYGGAGRDFVDGGTDYDIVKGQGGQDTIAGSLDDAIAEWQVFRTFESLDAFRSASTPTAVKRPDLVDGARDKFDYEN